MNVYDLIVMGMRLYADSLENEGQAFMHYCLTLLVFGKRKMLG